jgi:hypothetical protein
MAQHHVADGEVRVARQTALVTSLTLKGRNTAHAEIRLAAFKNTLHLMREVLAREIQRAARAR